MSAFDVNVDVEVATQFGAGPLDAGLTYPDDLSPYVRAATWHRGRSSYQSPFPAGHGTVTLDNSDGRFYSFNTASPYSPNVKVGGPIRIRAAHNAITYKQIYGYVQSWSSPFPTEREELITVPFVETYARLVRKTIRASFTEESTDARIDAILDEAGWPAALRLLDAGVAEVATLTDVESTVAHRLLETVVAEQGEVFQAGGGWVRFKNRVANSGVSPAATFGPDAPDLIYTDVTYDDNDELLYNEARVTIESGEQGVASDVTSPPGPITFPPFTSIDIINQPEAQGVAEWIVGKHKDLTRRITGLTIDPAGDPDNLWPEVLGRELRDTIAVKIKFPGSTDTFNQDVAIESIDHSFVAGGTWRVIYTCHPLSEFETREYWILGMSQLGTGTRLA